MASEERPQEGTKRGREPLSPAKRKRLDKVFEVASKKADAAAAAADFDYASELLGQCVSGEPGNATYVNKYIENLQKKYNNNKKGSPLAQFKERGARGAMKKALTQGQWDEVIRHGLKVLTVNPWDLSALLGMATAATRCGDRDCELCYLKAALIGSPKDPASNRLYAIALADRGLLDQAITFWHRVEEVLPNDDEAKRTIATLTVEKQRASGKFDNDDEDEATRRRRLRTQKQEELTLEQRLQRKVQNEPDSTAPLLELAQYYVNADQFAEAEGPLSKARQLAPDDVDIREKWEDCQLRHMRQRLANTRDPETRKKLERQYFEKEVLVYQNRIERYPNNLTFRYELGYRYMKTKRYPEAIRELQAAQNDPRRKGACMLVLGECFQQIKQYRLAMSHYESAVQEIPDREAENKRRALYLAGRLALYLRDFDVAEKHLTTVAALDFTYKDVSELLDKLTRLRDNPEALAAAKPKEAATEAAAEADGPATSGPKDT
jgi:tetratricopeptide (TPR) repeat protein